MGGLDGGAIRNFNSDGIGGEPFVEYRAGETNVGFGAGGVGGQDGGTSRRSRL
jgi:hypothetical protein